MFKERAILTLNVFFFSLKTIILKAESYLKREEEKKLIDQTTISKEKFYFSLWKDKHFVKYDIIVLILTI